MKTTEFAVFLTAAVLAGVAFLLAILLAALAAYYYFVVERAQRLTTLR